MGGRYALERELARGGMATVYLAQDQLLNRAVAVKVLTGDADPRERDAFLREARAAAGLGHPNIVDVYDAGVEGRLRFIVMEYVPGETLRDVIAREAPLHPRAAADLAIRLAEALDYGHRRGVIHCDVKPGNVLLSELDEPKIVDFGIARTMSASADLTTTIAGTVGYISPEQVEGERLDGRADVYSLSAVLYEMLSGTPPFTGANLAAVAAQRLTRPPTPLRERNAAVPPRLEAIVMRGLARAPEDRPATAHDLAEELRAFLAGAPETATRRAAPPVEGHTERISVARRPAPTAPVAQAAARGPGKKPWLFLAVAGTLAAVLTALIVLLSANLVDFGGTANATVPEATGARIDDAAKRIQDAGLTVREVSFVRDPAPFGTVIAQEPPPAQARKSGDGVDLRVSLGSENP